MARAFDTVESAYTAPLRERAELRYRLDAYRVKADSNGRSASPTVRSGLAEARDAADAVPCDVALLRFLVEQYQFLTRDLPVPSRRPPPLLAGSGPGRIVLMTTSTTQEPCAQPGCDGFIEDGYCNVCGSPGASSGTPVPRRRSHGQDDVARRGGIAVGHAGHRDRPGGTELRGRTRTRGRGRLDPHGPDQLDPARERGPRLGPLGRDGHQVDAPRRHHLDAPARAPPGRGPHDGPQRPHP
ncbi:hypothetical protein NKG05_02010 [Oerskovia sp. M15]